jgi:hypothetical protein
MRSCLKLIEACQPLYIPWLQPETGQGAIHRAVDSRRWAILPGQRERCPKVLFGKPPRATRRAVGLGPFSISSQAQGRGKEFTESYLMGCNPPRFVPRQENLLLSSCSQEVEGRREGLFPPPRAHGGAKLEEGAAYRRCGAVPGLDL